MYFQYHVVSYRFSQMYKSLILFLWSIFCICGFVSAQTPLTYPAYLQELNKIDINTTQIVSQQSISRYDLVRLLNTIDCQDCILPDMQTRNTYSGAFWNTFRMLPGNYFDDIYASGSFYNNTDYYYCVAYAGEQGYVNGYPRLTSTLCPGKFCGSNITRYAEFLQVWFNILSKHIYQDYQVNWTDLGQRLLTTPSDRLRNMFTISDMKLIQDNIRICEDNLCKLNSPQELSIYTKYCTYHADDCKLRTFNYIGPGKRPIAELNILVDRGLIDILDANRMQINQLIGGETILQLLYKTKQQFSCAFDYDYDRDKILNAVDNSPTTYNPNQKDTDGDGIGDTSDPDIDNDGINNPIGIVDDAHHIDIDMYTGSDDVIDNCLYVSNPDQQDKDRDGIGDACEDNTLFAMSISGKPLYGYAPLSVSFNTVLQGLYDRIVWDFGDGTQGSGTKPKHIYQQVGNYLVKASAYHRGVKVGGGALTVVVGDQTQYEIGFQALASPLMGYAPLSVLLSTAYEGPIDQVRWSLDGQNFSKDPDKTWTYIFLTSGVYDIVARAYHGEDIVGISKLNVQVFASGQTYSGIGPIGSNLSADSLLCNVGQTLTFHTAITGFDLSDVHSVKRDFGDGVIISNRLLDINKTCTKPGPNIVVQTIVLDDGRSLENILNTYVSEQDTHLGKGSFLTAKPLLQNVHKPIVYVLSTENIPFENISVIRCEYGDQAIDIFSKGSLPSDLTFAHTYHQQGMYMTTCYLYTTDGSVLINQATVQVVDHMCHISGIQTLKCDMDGDNIPDLCDDDIDGDGTPNLIGILIQENPPLCNIGIDMIDPIRYQTQLDLVSSGTNLDNCIFMINSDQSNSDQDEYGDVCEPLGFGPSSNTSGSTIDSNNPNVPNGNDIGPDFPNVPDGTNTGPNTDPNNPNDPNGDSDQDGLTDELDQCPGIPESFNGNADDDGCPDVIGLPDILNPWVQVSSCLLCPCPLADFQADFKEGDMVRVTLRDLAGVVIYKYSNTRIIKQAELEQ